MRLSDKPVTYRSFGALAALGAVGAVCTLLCCAWGPSAAAQDWVGPLTRLSPPDWSLVTEDGGSATLETRIAIARQLGRFGPVADAQALLLQALEHELDPALRDEVLRSLARRGAAQAVAPATALLEASETPVGAAFLVLSAVADRPAVLSAIAQLQRPAMAAQARWALLRMGGLSLFPLVEALSRPQPGDGGAAPDQRALAEVLGALGDARAVDALLGYLGRSTAAGDGPQRIAALDALSQLGRSGSLGKPGTRSHDAVAAAAVVALAGDSAAPVRSVLAALRCLRHVASPRELPALTALLSGRSGPVRAAALRAIAHADRAAAKPHLDAALRGPDRTAKRAAMSALFEEPHVRWAPLLREQLATTALEHAASALTRIADGRGLPVLLEAAEAMPERRALLARAVAIALHRHATRLDTAHRDAGLALLRGLPSSPRALRLRALARDPAVVAPVRAALSSSDPALRAAAGAAAEALLDGTLAPHLTDALDGETDPEAFRRMADAALRQGVAVRITALWPHLEDDATAPEALQLLAAAMPRASGTARTAAARALRLALRRDGRRPARTRAAAALALGHSADPSAHTPLLMALDDPDDRIRLAAARALSQLGGRGLDADLAPAARVERSAAVHDALREAIERAGGVEPSGASTGARRPGELLEVRAGVQAPGGGEVLLDVRTVDGRWRRVRSGGQGELILPDLVGGSAEVTRVDAP